MRIFLPAISYSALSSTSLSSSTPSRPGPEFHADEDPATRGCTSSLLGGDKMMKQDKKISSSVIQLTTEQVPPANLLVWSKVKTRLLPPHYGGEIKYTYTWKDDQSGEELHSVAHQVAQMASETIFDHTKQDTEDMCTDIENSMLAFTRFCYENLDHVKGFSVKVTAKRGELATFCPAFHVDYVPVRWIQTMFGPGTLFVDPELHEDNFYIQRIRNGSRLVEAAAGNDGPEWKNHLMDQSGIVPQQARTGQPLLMIGGAWNHTAKEGKTPLPGVLHRSPHNVPRKQGRVVVVMDVNIRDDEEHSCSNHDVDGNAGGGHGHGVCTC